MHALLSVASYMMKVANLGSHPQHEWFDTDWQENMKTELKKYHRHENPKTQNIVWYTGGNTGCVNT